MTKSGIQMSKQECYGYALGKSLRGVFQKKSMGNDSWEGAR